MWQEPWFFATLPRGHPLPPTLAAPTPQAGGRSGGRGCCDAPPPQAQAREGAGETADGFCSLLGRACRLNCARLTLPPCSNAGWAGCCRTPSGYHHRTRRCGACTGSRACERQHAGGPWHHGHGYDNQHQDALKQRQCGPASGGSGGSGGKKIEAQQEHCSECIDCTDICAFAYYCSCGVQGDGM